jgi:hypothetical protein
LDGLKAHEIDSTLRFVRGQPSSGDRAELTTAHARCGDRAGRLPHGRLSVHARQWI